MGLELLTKSLLIVIRATCTLIPIMRDGQSGANYKGAGIL